MKISTSILVLLLLLANIINAQKTFDISKKDVDSITLKKYKIFAVAIYEKINFVGDKYFDDNKRFKLNIEQLKYADQEFNNQYVKATLSQYEKQLNDTVKFPYSRKDLKRKSNSELLNQYEKVVQKDWKKKIKNYDRYYYGYLNNDNEKIVFLRCDPHKIKYFSIPGTGEKLLDILTIYVYNIDQNILSLAGWANFKEL